MFKRKPQPQLRNPKVHVPQEFHARNDPIVVAGNKDHRGSQLVTEAASERNLHLLVPSLMLRQHRQSSDGSRSARCWTPQPDSCTRPGPMKTVSMKKVIASDYIIFHEVFLDVDAKRTAYTAKQHHLQMKMDMGRQPDDVSVLIRLGEKLRRMGEYKQSLVQLDKAVVLKPSDVVAFRQRGTTKRMMCKYFEALGDLDVAFMLNSNDKITLRCRADIETQMGNFYGALQNLAAAEMLDPYDPATLIYRASTKWKMGEELEALKDLAEALDKWVHLPCGARMQYHGGSPSLRRSNVDKNLGALMDLCDALSLELELVARKDKALHICTLIQRAITNALMGRYEYAFKDLGKGARLTPGEPFLLFVRGVLKGNIENYADGLTDLNRALTAVPDDSVLLRHRGVILCLMGKYQEALEDLDMATQNIAELKPEHLCVRGETKCLMNNFEEALTDLEMADMMEPDNAYTLASRGAIKACMRSYEDALVDLDRAVKLEPNNHFAVMWRGTVKLLLKQNQGAREDLVHALRMWGQDDRDVLAVMAGMWQENGVYDKAIDCARRALQESLHRRPYLLVPISQTHCRSLLRHCEGISSK
eukprot:jgi/Botrbrau1/22367/Bobra.0002s0044.1